MYCTKNLAIQKPSSKGVLIGRVGEEEQSVCTIMMAHTLFLSV